jgi:hypothetical protein
VTCARERPSRRAISAWEVPHCGALVHPFSDGPRLVYNLLPFVVVDTCIVGSASDFRDGSGGLPDAPRTVRRCRRVDRGR